MKVIETNCLFALGEGVIELVAVPFQEVVDLMNSVVGTGRSPAVKMNVT